MPFFVQLRCKPELRVRIYLRSRMRNTCNRNWVSRATSLPGGLHWERDYVGLAMFIIDVPHLQHAKEYRTQTLSLMIYTQGIGFTACCSVSNRCEVEPNVQQKYYRMQ